MDKNGETHQINISDNELKKVKQNDKGSYYWFEIKLLLLLFFL